MGEDVTSTVADAGAQTGGKGAVAATSRGRAVDIVRAALAAAGDEGHDALTRTQMLMELAIELQRRPALPEHLQAAIALYDEALTVCPESEILLAARITARRGTALQAVPEEGTALLEEALAAYDRALPVLERLGTAEEAAETDMNRGLVLQQLTAYGRARIGEATAAYQRALRTFTARRYPVEFALLQNNLAAAFLSMPAAGGSTKVSEALAVQCFEQALKAVGRERHPAEYAMLQNNLGNALQYATSGHPLENQLRALAAYEEALSVRTRASSPLEYANTIANKANCLRNLPDEPSRSAAGDNVRAARACYLEAREIFAAHGESAKAQIVTEALAELELAP
jgi:tetratricopeptide (TPR) repeat protein